MQTASTDTKHRLKIIVAQDSMSASVMFRMPPSEDSPYTLDELMSEINKLGIVYGIDNEAIEAALENIEINKPIKIASGLIPEKGIDAKFEFHFDTSDKHRPKEGTDGHIDYHDLSFIQNTAEGFVLVTKTPPLHGKPGKNLLGKEIQGPPGRDIPFKSGSNTVVSDDGLQLMSTANGAIICQHGTVAVQDVLVIRGDVDFSVGNIDCSGSVKVGGNVKAGFNLKVAGDLEIAGNVEDATIECKGNVLIKGGFFGGAGYIKADGSITVKFAEGQRMESGDDINIGGEIINCNLIAGKNVVISGRRGKIVGGDVKAGTEIRAAVLGSDAGTATHLMVGYDPELMEQLQRVTSEIKRLNDDQQRIKEALYALYRLQADGKLPAEKKTALDKLETFMKEIPENLKKLESRKIEIEKKFEKFSEARIIAEEIIYPGVRASFGIVYREVTEEKSRCQLTYDGSLVSISEFKE